MNVSLDNKCSNNRPASHHFPGKPPDKDFPWLRTGSCYRFTGMKSCLATLVLSVGLCGTWASAKPNPADTFDPLKFEEYQAKAEQGDARGQAMLGRCYATGQGVEQNPTEAVKWLRKSAEQGDARGQCGLGTCYAMGMGVKKDDAEAVKWYRKAADQDYATAQSNLGSCYAMGEGVEKDAAEAVKWFRKSADQGDARGQCGLGFCYYQGIGVKKDFAAAVKWLRQAAGQGDAGGQYGLGLCYDEGNGVPQNSTEAAKWFRKSAEQGFAGAQFNRGCCYAKGEGVAKDAAEAVKWYRKAAEQGHPAAQANLGVCYQSGEGIAKDVAEAVKWYRKAAEQGHPAAQSNLGACYQSGEGIAKDVAEAVKWFRQAAGQGNAGAQYNLGFCYLQGIGVEKDVAEAVKWYRKAAGQGFAEAQSNLGGCYQNGEGVVKDLAEAVKWYRKAAEQGLAQAQSNLGGCYQNGEGVVKDFAEAVKWYRKAAEQGLAQAQSKLGFCYYQGEGIKKDAAEAVKWFRKSADQDYAGAQYNLGLCYYLGEGVEKDFAEAMKWYRKAAEHGDPGAQFNLGVYYRDGQGVVKDEVEAAKWFLKAAEQGHVTSQYSLGLSYQKGIGVAQDSSEAVTWYRKAAAQGFAEAQYSLGLRYSDGEGVEKNLAEAVTWFRKAAAQGHSTSQYNLGICYSQGLGVEKDVAEAEKWYRKAAKQGLAIAQRNLDASLAEGNKSGGAATAAGLTAAQRRQRLIDHLGANFNSIKWEPVIFEHLGLIYDNRPEPLQVEIEDLQRQAATDPQDAACRYRLGYLLKFGGRIDEGDRQIKDAEAIYRKRLEADPVDLQGLTGLALCLRGTEEGGRMALRATEVAPQAWESWSALAQHQGQAILLKCFEGVANLPEGGVDMSRLQEALQFQAQSEEQSKAIFDLGRETFASSLKAIEVAPDDSESFLRHLAIRLKVLLFVNSLHRMRQESAPDQAEVDRQSLELLKKAATLCRDRPDALGAVTLLRLMTAYSLLPKNAEGKPESNILEKLQDEVLTQVLARLRELGDSPDTSLAAPACEAYGAVVFLASFYGLHPPLTADVSTVLARAVRLAPRRCLAWDLRIHYAGVKPDGQITADSPEAYTLAVERAKVLKTGRSQALVGLCSQKKESSKAAWERALKLEPENLEYLLNLVAVSLRISQTEKARTAAIGLLQKAAEIWYANVQWQRRPELDAFRLRIFAVQQALGGDLEGARRTVAKVLADHPGDAGALSLQTLVADNSQPEPTQDRPDKPASQRQKRRP